jgi:hypothetical protein
MFSFIVNTLVAGAVFYNIHQCLKDKGKDSRRFYKHYFIVMSLLLSLDNSLSFIFRRLPYYRALKGGLLLWLSIPMSTGSHFIYSVYVKNIYQLFEGDIDTVISNFKGYYEHIKSKYDEMVGSVHEETISKQSGIQKKKTAADEVSDIDPTSEDESNKSKKD